MNKLEHADASAPESIVKKRIASIDIMRGLVMVIMLMDHVRERIFLHKQVSDPMDIETTPPELFFSRLAAHFCAPAFVFLTGLSAWLYSHPANRDFRSPTLFLLKRGLFLIFLECTFVTFSWMGSYHTIWLQVIWAIGLSMISLAVLIKLPYKLIGFVGFVIVFGHNALTPIDFEPTEFGYTLWSILHDRNMLVDDGFIRIKASYPVLPWIGVIALGYFAGPLFARAYNPATRIKQLSMLGGACWVLLIALRGFNIYGETLPWEAQGTVLMTIMSFLNFTKYPPSLDFLLFTLGMMFFALALFERYPLKRLGIFENFGAAPMFFYILHLYVLLIMYQVLIGVVGPNQGDLYGVDQFWWVWGVTVALACVLYWPTKAFAEYKSKSGHPLLKYF